VEIRKLIKEISQDKTLIMSTHIMQEVEAICDKVVIINKGEIVAQDLLFNLKAEKGLISLFLETEEPLDKEWFGILEDIESINVLKSNQMEFLTFNVGGLRKELLEVVQKKSLSLLSLKQQEKNLESIFHQLTQSR